MGTGFVINVRIKLSLYQMIATKRGKNLVVSVWCVYILSYLIYAISNFYAVFDVNVGFGFENDFSSVGSKPIWELGLLNNLHIHAHPLAYQP